MITKAEEMMEKLKTESLSSHDELVSERTAYARAFIKNIRLKRVRKKAVEKKEGVTRLLAAERAKRENSALVEPLKKNVATVTAKASEQVGALVPSLGVAEKKVEVLKKEREGAIRELGELCAGKEWVEYERDWFQAKLQRTEHERDRYPDAASRVRSGAGNLQKLFSKDSSALQQHTEDH